MDGSGSTAVDVIVVSYNSRGRLRSCVQTLAREERFRVIVVDNASSDGSLDDVAGLPVVPVQLGRNAGFASGVAEGWRRGTAPLVLLINPDARLGVEDVRTLARVFDRPSVAVAAPRIVGDDGELEFSQRRYPRRRSTFARAFFLHRVFPRAAWADELVRDEGSYRTRGFPDWVSGACMMLRRSAVDSIGGIDAGFFMYCEDIDLCRRLRDAGHEIVFEPAAHAIHEGGASAPRPQLYPVLAASRIRYAGKHHGRLGALLERVGVGCEAFTHVFVARGGLPARRGYARSIAVALGVART